ncbi:serine-rich adhesin for platelets-like isoform X2 [Argopecten irradians]|uniref:serine-rich adhesin for platelets-like isoform X2 n=1 Tax=Argopecten irradians TaxID=31199 RepID=UPI00372366AB
MPKNKRTSPTKHVKQKESRASPSGKDKIFQSVQEMFGGQLEGEVVHMVLEECDWIVEKAVDILVNMCEPGIQADQESKNKLAQIAFDVLCSDGSSDSMSVSSHSSMASSEETSSSRSGILAKPHTNNSRENILNSTEIEGASGFDPSMIEFENFESAAPNDVKNVNVMNQFCADAEAWASSLDKGYKDFNPQSLPKHNSTDFTAELNSGKGMSPQCPAKTFLISDLDFASKERSDIGMFDIVCTDGSSNTCGADTSVSPNNTQKISTSNRGDTPTGIDARITSFHMEEKSREIEQNFADICHSPSHFDDQIYISPEKLVYTGSENLGRLGNEELNMILVKHDNQDSAVPVSPVSVFENLGKLAGEIAHMEFQTQDDTPSSVDVFNSDDCVEGLLDRFKSDFQNSGLADVNFKTDVYKDDAELGCTDSDKLENQYSLNVGGFTEPVLNRSGKTPDLQSCDSLSNVGNGTSDNKHVNLLNDVDNDQTKAEKALKEPAICGFNIDNQEIDLEQNTDSISSEQLYESDVNTSGSSSDSLNESLTRALNDSITQTESVSVLNKNDNEEVIRSLSCMSSHSEEELGEELTTALNKSVDFTSPGEESDPESSCGLDKAPPLRAKTLPKLHDSDSEEKLNEFSEKIRMEVQKENQPFEEKNPQPSPVILDSFKSALSVNACEFVPNVKQEVPLSSLFNVDTSSSNPNKPTFFTPKYISPPKSTRPMLPFDSKSQPPFSSGPQQQTSAWVTPLRHHSEQPTGTYHPDAGNPPLKGPTQHPPPHWVSATRAPREGHNPKPASPMRMTDIQVVQAQIQAGHKCFVMLRGLPGSGKSTLARNLQHAGEKPGVILSSDDYFVQDGIYKFEPHLLSEAHEWNRLRTIQNLHNGCTPIIVDNTNTQAWEMKPYVKQAQKFGYDIYFLEPDTLWRFQPKELARRNTHGVPIKKIQMMLERYQKGLTVEQVLGKPAAQSSLHQKVDGVRPSIPKYKPQNTNMAAHPGWRYPQNSLVQQYANSLGQDKKQHSVVTDTPKTNTEIEDNITEENFPQAMSSVPTQLYPNPSPPPLCSNENDNNNISKEDWKMWEKLGLSDLVQQFSKGGHKKPEIVSSAAEITDIDTNRGVPMDAQYKETPVVVKNMEQDNTCPETVPTTGQTSEQEDKGPKEILPDQVKEQENENNKAADLTVGCLGKDDIQESAVSTAENIKNSRSPGSHKGSLSSHLRDVSPSSDSTFHTCCEMLTDQEEISSSTPEYHIAGSQDTSLDLSNTSSKEEGQDVIIESDSTADVDLDMRITDGTSDLAQGDSPDSHMITSQKLDSSEPDSHIGDFDNQKMIENDKSSQEALGDIQTVKFEDHVTQITPAGDPSSQKISDDKLHSKLVSEDFDPQKTPENNVAVEDPETKLTSPDDVGPLDALADDLKTLSSDIIETQETSTDIHRTQQMLDVPDNHQVSTDILDSEQVSVKDLQTQRIPPDAAVTVVEDVVDEAVKCEAQSDSEQSNKASIETVPTQDSTLEESLLTSQDVAVDDSHQTVNDSQQDVSNIDTNKSSINDNKDSAVSIQQNVQSSNESTVPAIQTCSIDDIPKGVKDKVDELIRENVGTEINYSLDYTVTANELKAFLLFTDLKDDEKIMAEHYITHRLCGPKFTAQSSAQDDDNTVQQLLVIQEDLSKQTSGSSNTLKAVDWEEPKPARKQRHSKQSVVKHEESSSGSKSDVEKLENESCKTCLEPELEKEKVSSNTENSMNVENMNGWSHPQRQRERRTRNYRTRNSSSSMDDKDQRESTATSNVTPVACQALSKEEEASESSPSQSSLESSPTKPAKKKSNRRKLDPYKQGPFLEPEVKNRIIGSDWSFPVMSESDSVVKDVIPKRKMRNSSEQETHISPRDLKVLNAVNRREDPRHLIAGRTCYHILVSQNRDISEGRLETVIDKSVKDQHSVDCSTMTEENHEADLDFLQSSFPAIPMAELSEVLGQCGDNLQWAINLLLDWKYNIPLSSDDKDKFVTRMVQLQKSPTVPKFSFCAQPSSALRSPSSLLDMCVGFVESQQIAPRQDVENQIIMSSQHRLDSIEENIRLKRTLSRTYSQSAVTDEELKENILKELTSTAESDSTSDASDDKGVLQSQLDVSYVESWTANQANDFARGPSVESSNSGHRSDEETYDFQNLQSSSPVMSMPISRDIIQALQSQFGPVPHLSVVVGDVMVPLDYRTAQALHRCLMLTAHQQNMKRQRQLLEDEAYARRLQDEEILTTTSRPPPSLNPPVNLPQPFTGAPQTQHGPLPNGKGVTSLKDIINEEMDRQRKKEEEHKLLEASGNHDVLATRIKRNKLYEQFPGIDETLLDDIYRDNSYNLDNTVLAIRGFLIHNTEPPKNVMTAEASEAYEEKLIAAAKQQSLQEMMDNYMYSPEETETFQEHEDPDYDDFRAEANIHYRLRHECFQKAQEAYRRGMRDVASFYSKQGHSHTQKIKEANRRAADKILQSRNTLMKERSAVDLHGLHVDEAIEALERIIPEREEDLRVNPDKRKQHLVIITGRGNHSKGGIARIRPAVLRFLVTNGYKYSEIYKGCFKVLLKYR